MNKARHNAINTVVKNKLSRPVLFTIVGLPGSGKTYLSRQLAEELGAAHVSAEEIRYELFEQPSFSKEEEGVVKHMMLMMTERFLKAGLSVIYDTSVSRMADRRELRTLTNKLKAEHLLLWQQIDAATAFNRIQKRTGKAPEDAYAVKMDKDTFQRLLTTIQTPTNEENLVVSGKHTFAGQFQTILRKLFELQLVNDASLSQNLPNPGLVNLVAQSRGRMDKTKRNISIG